jgi:hypothetical protein
MKSVRFKACTLLLLIALTSCSSNSPRENENKNSTSPSSTTTTISPYELRLNQSSSWVERAIENAIETIEENYKSRGKSLYSKGETPTTILACSMKRFEAAFATVPEYSQSIESYEQVLELFPAPALVSWITTCSEAE